MTFGVAVGAALVRHAALEILAEIVGEDGRGFFVIRRRRRRAALFLQVKLFHQFFRHSFFFLLVRLTNTWPALMRDGPSYSGVRYHPCCVYHFVLLSFRT